MATLLEKQTYIENADQYATLLKRLEAAVVQAAVDVRAEDEPDPMTEAYRSRQRWAINVLAAPNTWARRMLPGLLTNATIATALFGDPPSDPSDNDVQFVANSLVDAFSDYVPEAV